MEEKKEIHTSQSKTSTTNNKQHKIKINSPTPKHDIKSKDPSFKNNNNNNNDNAQHLHPSKRQEMTAKQLKKQKKKKKKKLKSIGKKHPEFELTYDMMLGIRYAVSFSEPSVTTTTTNTVTRTMTNTMTHSTKTNTNTATSTYKLNNGPSLNYNISASSDQEPESTMIDSSDSDSDEENELESEFLETKKYKFPSLGSDTTPAHQMSDFKFKDYCPQIFRQLREWFRISTQEYLVTICGDFKLLEFISNSKSGQFFFFSHNSQFIIKTMTRTESIFLRKILPSYYQYVSQQPDTLLPKFYGMHRVKHVDDIHDQYDLKGSTQGRRATKAERKKGAILKDLDWIDEGKKIKIGSDKAKLFKDQLKKDTYWLRTEKIMDYSLLVGIHYLDRAKNTVVDGKDNIANVMLNNGKYKTLTTVDENKENNVIDANGKETVNKPSPIKTQQIDVIIEEEKKESDLPSLMYKNNSLSNVESGNLNDEKLKITVTPTTDKTITNKSDSSLMLQPSITSPLGSAEPSISNEDSSKIGLVFNDASSAEPDPKRRNSAPNIATVTPKEKDEDKSNNFDIESDKLQTFQNLVAQNMSLQTSKKSKKRHMQSQSLQTTDLNHILSEVKLPSLYNSNSEKPVSKSNDMLKKRGANSPMYRGHISVKHPKRYKRKTAEEMQFAPEDIDIPVGIRHEVAAENNEKKIESSEHERNDSAENEELKLNEHESASIDVDDLVEIEDNSGGDVCPWTTYHGGMVYGEDLENGTMGNSVYFVGLIDILQKYNKRKKLENWIKKMKYNKNSISSVPADLYAQRMCDFFEDKVV